MFYKFNKDSNEWYTGNEVHFPDGTKINPKNKLSHEGWEWHEEAPIEYIEWLKQFEL